MAILTIVCSTECMADHDRHEGWSLTFTCCQGHHWGPGQVTASWAPCDCATAEVDPGWGHLVVPARPSRCDETETAPLPAADEDGALRTGADRDGPQAAGMPGTAWTLLAQAHEHHKGLLWPSHPSAADLAGLRSWIRDCVAAI